MGCRPNRDVPLRVGAEFKSRERLETATSSLSGRSIASGGYGVTCAVRKVAAKSGLALERRRPDDIAAFILEYHAHQQGHQECHRQEVCSPSKQARH